MNLLKFFSDQFVHRVIGPHVRRHDKQETLLYLDHAPPHRKALLTDSMIDYGITHRLIPSRMTNLVQPADVCWFKTIKAQYQRRWTNW